MKRFAEGLARARKLATDVEIGLGEAAIRASRQAHGENRLPEVKGTSTLALFLESLRDKTLIVLMVAAALAIGVEVFRAKWEPGYDAHFIDGPAILAAVLIASVVTTLNRVRAQKEFRSLSQKREDISVKTLRNGDVREVSIFDIVVGDIVYLNGGDRVPADGALISAVDIAVDESMLTGESIAAEKSDSDVELHAGTVIESGNGVMVVEAVGTKTEMGQLRAALSEGEATPTPLQERLSKLADRIGTFGFVAAILTFIALILSSYLRGEIGTAIDIATVDIILESAIVAVTIIVVSVPEGLPLAVTISLAYSISRMMKDQNLVRKLDACETMGAATCICSDKTGTLTKNRMTVMRMFIGGRFVERDDAAQLSADEKRTLNDIAAINATAFLEHGPGGVRYVGNATECALLVLTEALGEDYRKTRAAADIVHQIGFTSDRKRMSTLVRRPDGRLVVLMKGAPEIVLERSTSLFDGDGSRRAMTQADAARLLEHVRTLSASGQRTLGLAYRELDDDSVLVGADMASMAERAEQDLIFFSLVGIADPVRPEVGPAVQAARRAGVDIKMVTGDNLTIARTIATELHLLDAGDVSLEGPDFRRRSDAELIPLLPKLRVLARSTPSDKHRLVKLLKANGEVVAVTGDGTNDATALKDADVGFSMGISGTEVAKEASDIVILDDNFASIVRAIEWGRSVFENIRKFLQFQLTVNVVAVITTLAAALMGAGLPLTAVQLLWVNLIMDTLAALALAAEPPSPHVLDQKPHGRSAPLITRSMWTTILAMGVVMIAILMSIVQGDFLVPSGTSTQAKLTFVFNTFVFMQLFNEVNARAARFDRSVLEGLSKSRLFVGVLVVTACLQVAIVEWGGTFFRTVPLTFDLWVRSIALGASVLVAGFVVRAVGRAIPEEWLLERNLDSTSLRHAR